jgi:hypothetical protein
VFDKMMLDNMIISSYNNNRIAFIHALLHQQKSIFIRIFMTNNLKEAEKQKQKQSISNIRESDN